MPETETFQVLDLLWLQPGVTMEDVASYQKMMQPIAQKHGGRPIAGFVVNTALKGDLEPDLINAFEFPSKDALEGLFSDPEYQKIIPIRDKTFDMSKHVLFNVTQLGATGGTP